jgi:hypothetical protein
MSKQFSRGQCVHCLRVVDKLTSDHLPPRSWYPTSTPENLEKWQVPSCQECNHNFGRLEEHLLINLGLCLDDDAEASKGIGTRALNALNALRAQNPRDFAIRYSKALRQLAERKTNSPGTNLIVLNSGPANEHLSIKASDLRCFAEKAVRGVLWMNGRGVVESNYTIELSTDQVPQTDFDAETRKHGVRFQQGPGFEVYWAPAVDDKIACQILILVFGKLVLRARVVPKSTPEPSLDSISAQVQN